MKPYNLSLYPADKSKNKENVETLSLFCSLNTYNNIVNFTFGTYVTFFSYFDLLLPQENSNKPFKYWAIICPYITLQAYHAYKYIF